MPFEDYLTIFVPSYIIIQGSNYTVSNYKITDMFLRCKTKYFTQKYLVWMHCGCLMCPNTTGVTDTNWLKVIVKMAQ